MMKPTLDVQGLYAALDAERRRRGLSWRQVAAEAGVSRSLLGRLGRGLKPDIDGFAAVVQWLGISADPFLGTGESHQVERLELFSAQLGRDRELSGDEVDALKDILGAAYRLMGGQQSEE